MNDYSTNSKKPRENAAESTERERRVNPVVKTGAVKQKSRFQKFAEAYIRERIEDAKKYVLKDVIAPAVQEILGSFASILVYGEPGRLSIPKRPTSVKRSYDKDYDRNRQANAQVARPRQAFENEDIVFPSYGDAEYALEELRKAIADYDIARVLDLYDTCQLTAPAAASNFGWTNLDNAKPVKLLDGSGYYLQLPRPMPID